jgi:hypothetical protein
VQSFGRRPVVTVAWGNAPGYGCSLNDLAEGHAHLRRHK